MNSLIAPRPSNGAARIVGVAAMVPLTMLRALLQARANHPPSSASSSGVVPSPAKGLDSSPPRPANGLVRSAIRLQPQVALQRLKLQRGEMRGSEVVDLFGRLPLASEGLGLGGDLRPVGDIGERGRGGR